jgi:hypothetical protein
MDRQAGNQFRGSIKPAPEFFYTLRRSGFMPFVFKVNDNELIDYGKKQLSHMDEWSTSEKRKHINARERIQGQTLYSSPGKTIGGNSPFFNAMSIAYNTHNPLILNPDTTWLTILNGLSHHISQNAETLRKHFVQHEGKKTLEVEVASPPLTFDPSEEVWLALISGTGEAIHDHIGKKYELLINNFSTTTMTDELASQVSMMSSLQHYFEYKWTLLCGLGEIRIEGTPDDWALIKQRLGVFSEFDLAWWTDSLMPIVQEIQNACEGKPDVEFWKHIYTKHRQGSGGEFSVTGWMNSFFPYIAGTEEGNMKKNPYVDWQNASGEGADSKDFPSGLSLAPVTLNDREKKYQLEVYGGLVGVAMNEDFSVTPVSGFTIQNVST